MDNCLFCKIIDGDIPADKLYEDDDVLAFRDIAPEAPNHFLVIPKKHIATISDLEPSDEALMGKIVRVGKDLAKEYGFEDNFRIVFNNGEVAGQMVFHIHMHILGGRKMNWPPG